MTKEQTNSWEEDFVEKGADLEHTRWSKWQEYFFSKCKTGRIDEDDKEVVLVLPRSLYDRWWLQINTLYSELSEAEKESDRREVRQYLPLIQEVISQEKEKMDKDFDGVVETLKTQINIWKNAYTKMEKDYSEARKELMEASQEKEKMIEAQKTTILFQKAGQCSSLHKAHVNNEYDNGWNCAVKAMLHYLKQPTLEEYQKAINLLQNK